MLNKIDCPSYIQTTQESENKEHTISVALVPYEQFHTLMSMVAKNNRYVIEVNTLMDDLCEAQRVGDINLAMSIITSRCRAYMAAE